MHITLSRIAIAGASASVLTLLVTSCAAPLWDSAPTVSISTAATNLPSSAGTSTAGTSSAGTSSSPSPSPTPVRLSTLTGLPEPVAKPVLVVKLDNTHNAQPHAGLSSADLVYLEEVEWGLTRIAAVFSSAVPDHIGPIRSARITDIELLAQYGSPAFAFSGAQSKLWPALNAAAFDDVSANKGGEGYSRDSKRPAPYNYFGDGNVLLKRAPEASVSTDMGFVFDEVAPPGGVPATKVTAKWPYASAQFTYDDLRGTYSVRLNGEPALGEEIPGQQHASNIVFQFVEQDDSGFHDHNGGRTPFAKTVGSGKATVVRDGKAWDATWSRPDEFSGTTFTLADGSTMPFKPGQQWVVLVRQDRTVAVRPAPAPIVVASPSPSRG